MDFVSPKVSVVIPTYNRAHVIRRSLYSVLSQTYENIEVIVVDDASTDNTAEVVASFQDARVIFLRQASRTGAAAARNIGIQTASGDYLAFQDSDDEWLCEKLEKQMSVMQRAADTVGVVFSGFLRFENKSAVYLPLGSATETNGRILGALLRGNFVTTQAVLVKKACLDKIGLFDESFPRLQDWELFIRLAVQYDFICIDEPLLIAFHSKQSITAEKASFPVALKQLLAKHEQLFRQHPLSMAKHYLMLAYCDIRSGRFLSAARGLRGVVRAVWAKVS